MAGAKKFERGGGHEQIPPGPHLPYKPSPPAVTAPLIPGATTSMLTQSSFRVTYLQPFVLIGQGEKTETDGDG